MACDYDLLPPPHCRVLEHDGRMLVVGQDGNVYFEASPDGYNPQTNLPVWTSAETKQMAWRRATALTNLITYAHNFRGLQERLQS